MSVTTRKQPVVPADMQRRDTPINRLDNQVLVRLYDRDYRRFNR